MNPINRREALKRLGASAVAPVLAYHPWVPRQEVGAPWAPLFFEESELETAVELSERILPATDTPGARAANVHQYVDWKLSEAAPRIQGLFRQGVRALREKSVSEHGRSFVELRDREKDELLERVSRHPATATFFEEAKRLTVEGYYRSEIGMMEELGYQGNAFLAEYEGCTHEEHRSWKKDI